MKNTGCSAHVRIITPRTGNTKVKKKIKKEYK
jgi:hypothetical protein